MGVNLVDGLLRSPYEDSKAQISFVSLVQGGEILLQRAMNRALALAWPCGAAGPGGDPVFLMLAALQHMCRYPLLAMQV